MSRSWLVVLALAFVPIALTVGCGDSENSVVNGPVVLEAVVLGKVETGQGAPVEGVSVQIEAWRSGCGEGEPILPSEPASQLVTDSAGLYYALLHAEADSFDACLTVEADPPAVLHLLAEADTGATLSFRAPEAPRDTAEVDFMLPPDRPILYSAISAEFARTCGLSTKGAAFCWGHVGLGPAFTLLYFDTSAVPLAVPGGIAFETIDPTGFHGCGITPAGAAYCWGSNWVGELGDGTGEGNEGAGSRNPVAVVGDHTFTAVTTGSNSFSCGVTTEGTGFCWGNNFVGQLGIGSEDWFSPVPAPVAGGLRFRDIQAGLSFACGVTASGAAYCWGSNWSGQLGDGTTTRRRSPVPVAGGLSFVEIDAGDDQACGIATGGGTYCWGNNRYGQLGDGTTADATTPVEVLTGVRFASVAAGGFHTCGLTNGGRAYCWGRNDRGQLGDGTQTDRLTPTPVATELAFVSLAAGEKHTCGLQGSGTAYCWGWGEHGELGTGTLEDHFTPVAVVDPE